MFDYGADLQNAYDEGYKKGKADAVRHGRWSKEWGNYKCSLCGALDDFADNYCPNCGAKMDR